MSDSSNSSTVTATVGPWVTKLWPSVFPVVSRTSSVSRGSSTRTAFGMARPLPIQRAVQSAASSSAVSNQAVPAYGPGLPASSQTRTVQKYRVLARSAGPS
ncbi:hypothetical protein GCM10027569_89720 [Flindersiella endophytica]